MCCRYHCAPNSVECASWCTSRDSCIIWNGTDILKDEGCKVIYDTKKDNVPSKQNCLQKNFRSRATFETLPFYIEPYVYKRGVSDTPFTGIDLRYQYHSFKNLRFRFKNTNHNICKENSGLEEDSLCNPRCVEIDRSRTMESTEISIERAFMSYDCEVGFYIFEKNTHKNWIGTAEDDYLLSVCADTFESSSRICGEYIFKMPAPEQVEREIPSTVILLDTKEFENSDKIVVFVPNPHFADKILVSLFLVSDEKNKQEVQKDVVKIPSDNYSPTKIVLDFIVQNGRYQVAVTPLKGDALVGKPSYSAILIRQNQGGHAPNIASSVLCSIIVIGLILGTYKRYQQIAEEAIIEPHTMVEAGKIVPRPLLVISSLEVIDHAQIVKDLCSYLKQWCGVGDIYFPLDDELGIHCGQRDPWKWAQNSYDCVRENGTVLFVAGPNQSLAGSTSLYPGLQENQAFLVTQEMRIFADQGRLLVIKFPYSDMKTIPSAVPHHLVKNALLLPDKMNDFLSLLLQESKRPICCKLPFLRIQPDILPKDLARQGGPEILKKIQELMDKEKIQVSTGQDKSCQFERFCFPGGEENVRKHLIEHSCSTEDEKNDLYCPSPTMKNDKTEKERIYDIQLEESLPSLKNLITRDKSTEYV